MKKKIILASKSIDRCEILKRAKISFDTISANINENEFKDRINNPIQLVKELAKAKVLYAKKKVLEKNIDAIIIGADTIVEFKGEIIGKANNEDQAFRILKKLQNESHNLLTGLAITETFYQKLIVDYENTVVYFAHLSDQEILTYVKSGEWKGRAGAYSIRDKASLFVKSINGSFSNVVGLPLFKINEILNKEFNFNLFERNKFLN
ncbi:MAG: nucleoside triphosphate pyrophosphatase [Promethearchaeota archaeon]